MKREGRGRTIDKTFVIITGSNIVYIKIAPTILGRVVIFHMYMFPIRI